MNVTVIHRPAPSETRRAWQLVSTLCIALTVLIHLL